MFDESFGYGRASQVRYDHFLESIHVCETLKFFNRAYQLLKVGGVLTVSVVDFHYWFNKVINIQKDETMADIQKIVALEGIEKRIFTDSDASGMYYHRTIFTKDRLKFYLERSFFFDYE